MKVLYYTFEFPPFHVGGLGTYAQEMARRFVNMGHSVTVFSKNPGDAVTSEVWKGVEVHRPQLVNMIDLLPIIMPGDVARWDSSSQNYFAEVLMYNILSSTKAVNTLVRKDERDFDIIVSHDWLSAIGGIASKRSLEKPLVFHVHSTEQGRTRNGSDTIRNLERNAGRIADLIITVSDAMKGSLISQGFNPEKIRAIPNGVDHEKYNPNREEFSDEKIQEFRKEIGVENDPMILYVGRLAWVKGVESLVKAMPIISKEEPDTKLVILGQGGEEGAIRDIIESEDLQENFITFFEFVEEKKIHMFYASCDLAIFPSKYEPVGITCTEAMSMGNPVIVGAKGVSGFREQVVPAGPNRCGAHIDPDSPNDIARFSIEILQDQKLRKKLGKNARKRVLKNYTLEKIAEETMATYEKVADIEEE